MIFPESVRPDIDGCAEPVQRRLPGFRGFSCENLTLGTRFGGRLATQAV